MTILKSAPRGVLLKSPPGLSGELDRTLELEGLDPDQRLAVTTEPGPLALIAGAGSGKTRTLTSRAAWLHLAEGVAPDRILTVSFTNKAVLEFDERLVGLLGEAKATAIEVRTFHSAAWRFSLRGWLGELGRGTIKIARPSQSRLVMGAALRTLGLAGQYKPAEALGEIGRHKALGRGPAAAELEPGLAAAWRRYRERMRELCLIDLDDVLVAAAHVLETRPAARAAIQARFDAVLVDEFQDASPIQGRWLELLCGRHNNLTAVGDPDQAIYGFRSGDGRVMVDFARTYPGATELRLEINYRSARAIVGAAERLIARNPGRHKRGAKAAAGASEGAVLLQRPDDPECEARELCGWIVRSLRRGVAASEIAVLARGGFYLGAIERRLATAAIPYEVIGRPALFEREESRLILAYLAAAGGHGGWRALDELTDHHPGLGPVALARIEAAVAARSERDPLAALGDEALHGELSPRQSAGAIELAETLAAVGRCLEREGIAAAAECAVEISGLGRELESEGSREAEEALGRIEQLVELFASFERAHGPDVPRLLSQLAAVGSRETLGDDRERVALSTIHAAKGLEWRYVWLVGAVEGQLPHHKSLEADPAGGVADERRIAYVAFTRAEDELRISAPLRNRSGRDCEPSRFIAEAGLAR